MRWKDGILIALISGIVGYLLHGYLSLGSLEVPLINGLWLGLSFLLGLLGGSDIVGVIRDWYKERKEKRATIRLILSEIELNQSRLKPLSDATKVLGSDEEISEENLFPNELNFNYRGFSVLQDKIGLLNEMAKIYKYYNELDVIKKGYPKLNIHESFSPDGQKINSGLPFSHLIYLEFNKKLGKHNNLSEIEGFLRHVKEVYSLGEELIIELKEQIGIKPTREGAEPPKEHLRTKAPDIRKLWSECENLKTQISKDRKEIREYIKNKSREGVPIYSKLDSIFDDGYFSQDEFGVLVNRTEGDEINKLVYDFATNGKMTKDEEYEEYVETIIKDEVLYKMYKAVFKNEADLNKKTNEFEQCLEKFEKRQVLK